MITKKRGLTVLLAQSSLFFVVAGYKKIESLLIDRFFFALFHTVAADS